MKIRIFNNVGGNNIRFNGGTVTFPIVLPGDPTQPLEAATKQYIDNNYATKQYVDSNFATKQYVNNIISTATSNINIYPNINFIIRPSLASIATYEIYYLILSIVAPSGLTNPDFWSISDGTLTVKNEVGTIVLTQSFSGTATNTSYGIGWMVYDGYFTTMGGIYTITVSGTLVYDNQLNIPFTKSETITVYSDAP